MSDTGRITPAATVILLREPMEVLAITRAAGMGFAGGAMAFPGGKVDALDVAQGPVFAGFEGLDPVDAAARIAGARETFEETGVLLSEGAIVFESKRAEARRALVAHKIGFADALAAFGHVLDADALRPFARWVPPAGLHRRFDTRFYLARLPAGETAAHDGAETTAARWMHPDKMLELHAAGEADLLFPTRCNVERLAGFGDVAALMADETPLVTVQPEVFERDGAMWLRIPQGIGYPVTERPLAAEMRRAPDAER